MYPISKQPVKVMLLVLMGESVWAVQPGGGELVFVSKERTSMRRIFAGGCFATMWEEGGHLDGPRKRMGEWRAKERYFL